MHGTETDFNLGAAHISAHMRRGVMAEMEPVGPSQHGTFYVTGARVLSKTDEVGRTGQDASQERIGLSTVDNGVVSPQVSNNSAV